MLHNVFMNQCNVNSRIVDIYYNSRSGPFLGVAGYLVLATKKPTRYDFVSERDVRRELGKMTITKI
jgi:hypothetical protein